MSNVQPLTDDNQTSDGGTLPVDSATRPCCEGIGGHTQDCAGSLSRMIAAAQVSDGIQCAPWCTEPGHPKEELRADQECWGPQYTTVLGLEPGAPALPLTVVSSDSPGLTVYARKEWYGLPHVRLNVFCEFLSTDVDISLTPAEARQLAANLVAVADEISSGQ